LLDNNEKEKGFKWDLQKINNSSDLVALISFAANIANRASKKVHSHYISLPWRAS
jgi:hypothetical protein